MENAAILAPLFGEGGIALNGVLTEIIDLLPVVIPVTIGFIALRKGISFVFGTLRRA